MSNFIKWCSCQQCRYKGSRRAAKQFVIRRKIRAERHACKMHLSFNKDHDNRVAVGYTD